VEAVAVATAGGGEQAVNNNNNGNGNSGGGIGDSNGGSNVGIGAGIGMGISDGVAGDSGDGFAGLVGMVRGRVAARLAAEPAAGGDAARVGELVRVELDDHARAALRQGRPRLDRGTEARVAAAVRDGLLGLGGLQRWLDDPLVENVTCNGADVVFVTYADGRRVRVGPVAGSDEELVALLRHAAAGAGQERRFDRGQPRLSLQLGDGSRLFAVMALCRRPSVTIRRHRLLSVDLAGLCRMGTVDARLRDLLAAVVRAGRNVVVAGGTNSGKTTLLRALAAAIDPAERLVTIEDSYELRLETLRADVVALQAREANVEGAGEVSMAQLVRWALRMSPDRVIVGEVRGAEVLDMCKAMSQGNDGSLATVHASSSQGALLRLATYALLGPQRLDLAAANLLIAGAVHLVVQLGRDRAGARVVTSVREVTGADGNRVCTNELFAPGPQGLAVPATPPTPGLRQALAEAGAPNSVFNHGGQW
jgi:Flp pilus assembly CpaF family ATPase